MSLLPDDFWKRAQAALAFLDANPALAAQVQSEVDEFYARNSALDRTKVGEGFIASLVLEKLSAADSQSAASTQTKKVA